MISQDERVRRAFTAIGGEVPPRTGADMVRIALLGRGIGSSLSPIMHQTEGRRLGLDYRYDLVDFDRLGLDDADLDAVVGAAQSHGFAGLNVTYPFKQVVVSLLDDLSPEARSIGAVNTVVLREGRRIGHNTDCWGFAQSLRQGLGDVPVSRILQIGAGGAGTAVARALAQVGASQIDVVDADRVKAAALAMQLTGEGIMARALSPDALPDALPGADGVVNATPVGMEKYPGTPLDPALLSPDHWVADIVYFPRETELLRRARALGCRILPGGGMAIYQAVRAFALFTGIEPDAGEMGRTFAAHA